MRLSKEARHTLQAMAKGAFLKSHRYLDGTKQYRLHPLEGEPHIVQRRVADALLSHGLVSSNQKFPTATYMLTEKGRSAAQSVR